jgi:REP element-mobilizing transposase RayT
MTARHRKIARQSTRLNDLDYSHPGAYFITLLTYQRECLLGKIAAGKIHLSPYGKMAHIEWFKSVSMPKEIKFHEDEFVVMPNHVHGIVWITSRDPSHVVGATGRSPLRDQLKDRSGPRPKSLSSFVAGSKPSVTKQINTARNTPGQHVWKRNYHDKIIRNERELQATREYIRDNPLRWELDRENPKLHNPIDRP